MIVIDSKKAASAIGGTKKIKGCDWITGSEIKKSVEYLNEQHIKEATNRGIDIIAIFATPFNPKGSLHALTMALFPAATTLKSSIK